jgi:hypothetical protein
MCSFHGKAPAAEKPASRVSYTLVHQAWMITSSAMPVSMV